MGRSKTISDMEPAERFEQAVREDRRYAPEAYEFLHHGLERATRAVFGDQEKGPRHVTGQQLCEALRDLALERWGWMAREVLRSWRITRTRDFGEMVFFMIGLELMGRQDSDRIEDFDDVYDFADAFARYEIPLPRQRAE